VLGKVSVALILASGGRARAKQQPAVQASVTRSMWSRSCACSLIFAWGRRRDPDGRYEGIFACIATAALTWLDLRRPGQRCCRGVLEQRLRDTVERRLIPQRARRSHARLNSSCGPVVV
jgi:hypothetical protein